MSTERRMARLWERMAALYGSRWELEYGPVASPTGDLAPLAAIWAEALADFTGESIATGLRKCLDREADHPPTLPEFLRLCGRATHSAAACHQPMLTATPRQAPAESPSARCAQLAGTLAETARQDLEPRIAGMTAEGRRDATRAYWLTLLQQKGPIGQTVARQLAKTHPTCQEAA